MNKDSGASKLTVMQNVIKNKFDKACTNRIQSENNVNDAIKQLFTTSSDFSTTNNAPQIKQDHSDLDPNKLCANLRILLSSSSCNVSDTKCNQQINTIINKLRELEIIL